MSRAAFPWMLAAGLLAATGAVADEVPGKASGKAIAADPSGGSGGKSGKFARQTIAVNDKERLYRLVVPKSLDLSQPSPLVFAFHGLGDSMDIMPWYSQLDRLAERQGFVLAYLNARNRAWPLVESWAKDDLAFFDALYADLNRRYNVDRNRVYLVGMSNGAYFSHLLAAKRSSQIAAIACHSGGLGLLNSDPKVNPKYAVLLIHGDEDVIVKVAESRKAKTAYEKWQHPVEYIEVAGLNHWWASRADINERIWDFFEQHPRQVPVK